MANSKHNPFDFPHQGRTRDVLDVLAAIVTGVLIWGVVVAAGLVIFISIAGAEIVTRDRLGREVFTTTHTRNGSVVTRDRFGREVITQGRH